MATSPSVTGRLTVITGPSGVGKGTLVTELLNQHPEIWLSISATTRTPRPGEADGVDYFFKNRDEFDQLLHQQGFLEWAEFAGNCYGTPREPVQAQLMKGRPVLLEIELEGARQLRKSFKQAFQIFLAPPSFEELERRIRGRATDPEDAIRRRLARAKEELDAKEEFDAVVINEDLNKALAEVKGFMELKT